MIFIILGTIGSGKTLFLTWLAHLYYYDNATIYANYKLKKIPYTNIKKIKDFLRITTQNNFFALDEFWLTADARRSGSLVNLISSRHITQSRKMGGGKTDVGITSQTMIQIDKRIRNISAVVYEPEIVERDENGKPTMLLVKYFLNTANERHKKTYEFYVPLVFEIGGMLIDIPESYDTFEIVDEMDSGRAEELEGLTNKYYDAPPESAIKLSSYIIMEELSQGKTVTPADAKNIANYIIILREQPDEEE